MFTLVEKDGKLGFYDKNAYAIQIFEFLHTIEQITNNHKDKQLPARYSTIEKEEDVTLMFIEDGVNDGELDYHVRIYKENGKTMVHFSEPLPIEHLGRIHMLLRMFMPYYFVANDIVDESNPDAMLIRGWLQRVFHHEHVVPVGQLDRSQTSTLQMQLDLNSVTVWLSDIFNPPYHVNADWDNGIATFSLQINDLKDYNHIEPIQQLVVVA